MSRSDPSFVPALRFHWLTRYYGRLVALTNLDSIYQKAVLGQIGLEGKKHVLDLACGTGSLALMLKYQYPDSQVQGLDADPVMLERARRKAATTDLGIEFVEAMSYDMPYPVNSFDIVVSCLFFHHLISENKVLTLAEIARVLRPGGRLVVCDWGKPANPFFQATFGLVRLLDGFEVTRENREGRLPEIICSNGFSEVAVIQRITWLVGTLDLITASLKSSPNALMQNN